MSKLVDLTGMKQKNGKLKAIKRIKINPTDREGKWMCECECGRITYITRGHFKDESIKSCGKCNLLKKEK